MSEFILELANGQRNVGLLKNIGKRALSFFNNKFDSTEIPSSSMDMVWPSAPELALLGFGDTIPEATTALAEIDEK